MNSNKELEIKTMSDLNTTRYQDWIGREEVRTDVVSYGQHKAWPIP